MQVSVSGQLPEEVPVGLILLRTQLLVVLQVRDADKFPQALGFEVLHLFFSE